MRVTKTVVVILMLVLTNHNVMAEDDQTSASTTSKASRNGTSKKSSDPLVIRSANDTIPTVVMGYCHPVANGNFDPLMADSTLTPNVQAKEFLNNKEHLALEGTTNASILMEPKHGALYKVTEDDVGKYYSEGASLDPAVNYFIYVPEKGFTGKDSATFLVDFNTVKVKLIYSLPVTGENMISECDRSCEKQEWEISSTLPPDKAAKPKRLIYAVIIKDYKSPIKAKSNILTYSPNTVIAIDQESNEGTVHINSYSSNDGWIPREIIATQNQFSRVVKWAGVTNITDEGIDTSSTYTLNHDGSFEFTGGDRCGSVTVKGHLYRFKNILWLRDEKNHELSIYNTYQILPSGKLCSLSGSCQND